MSVDVLRVGGVVVPVRIGATEAERGTPQPLEMTLEIHLHTRVAAHTDDLSASIDYVKATDTAVAALTVRDFKLLEAAAEVVARDVLALGAKRIHVRLRKRRPPMPVAAEYAEIEITRP